MRRQAVRSCCRQLALASRTGLPAALLLECLPGREASELRRRLVAGEDPARALHAAGWLSGAEAARLGAAVRAGEGAAVLRQLADGWKQDARGGEERLGLIYPLLVLALGAVTAGVAGGVLLPGLLPTLGVVETVAGLPPATRLLMRAVAGWRVLAAAGVAGAAGLGLCLAGRLGWPGARLALALPGWGSVLLWRERWKLLDGMARLARAGGLTGEGVTSLLAACGNPWVRRRLKRALAGAEVSPAEALADAFLPPVLAAQVRAARRAGDGAGACRELAEYCRRAEQGCRRVAVALMEPALTLAAAGVVAVVALAVVQPLYLALAALR